MNGIPDKQIKASDTLVKCAKCAGSGQTKKADGSSQMCYDCRGTGQKSGGYATK